MRATSLLSLCSSAVVHSRSPISSKSAPPVIRIENATFFRQHPASENASNPPLFSGLTFSLPSFPPRAQCWSIVSPSSAGKTTFLEVLQGQHICIPPNARSFPYLLTDDIAAKDPHLRTPTRAIRYIGFDGQSSAAGGLGTRGAYLSARYESRREDTDFSLLDYLKGYTSLNPSEEILLPERFRKNEDTVSHVVHQLNLEALLDLPVGNLSNGQTRRARIAKALMGGPEVLLLDEPFMGLDPPTTSTISSLLCTLALNNNPRIILGLRPQDHLPEWITHLVYLNSDHSIAHLGPRKVDSNALPTSKDRKLSPIKHRDIGSKQSRSNGQSATLWPGANTDEPNEDLSELSGRTGSTGSSEEVLVEMTGVEVKYGEKKVLGDWEQMVNEQAKKGLWWTVKRGDRWGIFGPNGSGKTTILSLICSDHPQTYSLPVKLFGSSRLPTPGQPGISIFDVQSRIGHSSPEVHAFFPRELSIRETLENAWADTFRGKAMLIHENDVVVEACLRWFERELNPTFTGPDPADPRLGRKGIKPLNVYLQGDVDWADAVRFGDVSIAAQKVALLLRALVKKPDIVILDEAFSAMDTTTRDKCMTFLAHGQHKFLAQRKGVTGVTGAEHLYMTAFARDGEVAISGLEARQALICVSHLAEEVPDLVTEYLCLPEPNEGTPVRFGTIEKSNKNSMWWDHIWKV